MTTRGTVPPADQRIRALEASNAVLRRELMDATSGGWCSLWRTVLVGGALIAGAFIAGTAWGDTISISGTMVSLEPSAEPGAVAVVTMDNVSMNGPLDNKAYLLTMPGLAVEAVFTWEVMITGEDRITITPPDGFVCQPLDCIATVPEGQAGRILLLEWIGG